MNFIPIGSSQQSIVVVVVVVVLLLFCLFGGDLFILPLDSI